MTGEEFRDRVASNTETALSRLGSDKYLIAATGANLETPAVLRAAATDAASGRDLFEQWADEESGAAGDAFAEAAAAERDHYERIVTDLAEAPGPDRDEAVHAALQAQTATAERVAAGLVGRGLVRERTGLQYVNFFVNEGDEGRADLFRDVRGTAEQHVERGTALLEDLCDDEQDWERAGEAAETVVDSAYAAYASALESMGVDPKPVC